MSMHETLHALVRSDGPVLSPDVPIRRAVAILISRSVSAAPVIDDSGTLVGILSQKDCFRPTLNASYYREWKGNVSDFMTPDVIALSAGIDIADAAEAFLSHSHHVFPVLEAGQFIGMLHRTDVLGRLVELS